MADVTAILTPREVRIIQSMINFLDDQCICCPSELLDCDIEEYNELSDKFERIITNARL